MKPTWWCFPRRCRGLGTDPQSSKAIMVIEGKYYGKQPVSLGTGRQFLGLDSDLSARSTIFAATLTSMSVVHLLQGKGKGKPFCVGVLPGRKGEHDLLGLFAIDLRGYHQSGG
jgi:hypothetical protein